MKPIRIVFALSLLAAFPAASFAERYRIDELPPLALDYGSEARAINENGDVVGMSSGLRTGYPVSVLWVDLKPIYLTGLRISGSIPTDINNGGLVVGATDEFNLQSYTWKTGELKPLGPTEGCCSQATAINDQGRIAVTFAHLNTPHRGGYWDGGEFHELPGLGGTTVNTYGMNGLGQIVGLADTSSQQWRGFHFDGEKMVALEALTEKGIHFAYDINDTGTIVGQSDGLPVRWKRGRIELLPGIGDPYGGSAQAINNKGHAVGIVYKPGSFAKAALWKKKKVIDLNGCLPKGSKWELSIAYDINEKGCIVGQGYLNGESRGFIMTPIGRE